jgi:hypothetical protein
MFAKIKTAWSNFVKKHIVADFPYPDECWDCKEGFCAGNPACPLMKSIQEFKKPTEK